MPLIPAEKGQDSAGKSGEIDGGGQAELPLFPVPQGVLAARFCKTFRREFGIMCQDDLTC